MKPLSDAEQDQLIDILNNFKNPAAMNLENVDGFFAALQCAPQTMPLSELLNEVWGGGEMLDEDAFESEQKSNLFFQLLLRHWNDVTDRLEADDAFFPLFLGEG